MRQFLPRPAASVAALAAVAVVVTGGVAAPGGARDGAWRLAAQASEGGMGRWVGHRGVPGGRPPGLATVRPGSRAPAASAPGRTIVLLNGDKLITAPAGVPGLVSARSRLAGPILALDLGGQAYDIPQVALAYLGRGLDPDLFRVSSLLRAETTARLPVTVSYRGRVPSLPGVTIRRAGGGTAQGYLTPAGAGAFGAALARQFIADHARGSYGQDGMFAGAVSIRLAGVPGTERPATAFPMHTLTVTGTNLAGKPDTGDEVDIFNADNSSRFADLVESVNFFDKGVAKFSVPAGHYWAIGAFPTILKNRRQIEWHVPILPQFTVSANTTVHINERAADGLVGVKTPQATVPVNEVIELRHTSATGPASSAWWLGGYAPFFISPTTRRATVGTMQAYVFEQLFSPAKAPGTPYEYNVAFGDTSGLIRPQQHVVHPSSLATVHARYYSPVSTTGYEARFGVFPAQWPVAGVLFLPRRMPRQQTEYMTGNPAILWSGTAQESNPGGGQSDDLRIFHAGQRFAENWNASPLHAGYNTNLIGAANVAGAIPSASRKGDALTLDVTPFSDSTLGHVSASGFYAGFGGRKPLVSGHYEIDENGKVIVAGNPLEKFKQIGPFGEFHDMVRLSPRPATIRFALNAAEKAKVAGLSTGSRTVWTWRSVRGSSGARLPAGWNCGLTRFGTPAGGRSCAVEPMMTIEYAVARLSLLEATQPGPQAIHLSVGHLQLVKPIKVTRASVSVSFNSGKTWHRATVTGHDGSYTAVFTAPAGALVSLRTTAADAAGSSIAETITNAYQTSS